MFNSNSGYVGYSRSVRSQNAIEDYEVPLSFINKSLIEEFLSVYDEFKPLETVPVSLWKFVAKSTSPSSWHHTSNRYNKTNHYSLVEIAEKLIEDLDYWKELYKKELEEKRHEKTKGLENLRLAVITAEIWGGTRKHPKMIGTEEVLCIIKGAYGYPVTESENSRYKLDASKNTVGLEYKIEDYNELVKKYKQFKSKKRAINKLVKKLV